MLDLGWQEFIVIALVLVLIVGPKDLPEMLRTFGKTTKKLRGMAGDFRKQFDEALKEAELDDVSSMISDARKFNPRNALKDVIDPIESAGRDIKAGLNEAAKSTGPAPSVAKSADTEKVSEKVDPTASKTANSSKKPADGPAAKKPSTRKSAASKTTGKAGSATTKSASSKSASSKSKTAVGSAKSGAKASAAAAKAGSSEKPAASKARKTSTRTKSTASKSRTAASADSPATRKAAPGASGDKA